MENEERLEFIKGVYENDEDIHQYDLYWLIEQAVMLKEIADTWVSIETNGRVEDADNFFTIVQDILTDDEC